MHRSSLGSIPALLALPVLLACGGGAGDQASPAPAPAPAAAPASATAATPEIGDADAAGGGELAAVDWITVDEGARTVRLELVVGSTDANNRWNYNGYANGEATIVVPVGYEVVLNLENLDPVNYHSAAVLVPAASYPAVFEAGTAPVFEGAATPNPESMNESTAPNASHSIQFTASEAGVYALVCLVPAHAVTGMWIGFEVSGNGESGLRI